MTKEDARFSVMGAISMALKDTTLQQGFEIICKENTELEMTVGTLRTFSNEQATCIERLEKENAELKEKLKPENCLKLLAKEGYIKFSSDQLTYAKTIIQDLLDNTDEYARQRAEDFLKENK